MGDLNIDLVSQVVGHLNIEPKQAKGFIYG